MSIFSNKGWVKIKLRSLCIIIMIINIYNNDNYGVWLLFNMTLKTFHIVQSCPCPNSSVTEWNILSPFPTSIVHLKRCLIWTFSICHQNIRRPIFLKDMWSPRWPFFTIFCKIQVTDFFVWKLKFIKSLRCFCFFKKVSMYYFGF